MGILLWILAGLVAGWLTGKIMQGSGYGFFVDILLGIAGAIVGGYLARAIGLDPHGFIYSTLVAVAGAIILVVIVRLLKRA